MFFPILHNFKLHNFKPAARDACFPAGFLTRLDSYHRIDCDAGIVSARVPLALFFEF